jgi:hypothetical protein
MRKRDGVSESERAKWGHAGEILINSESLLANSKGIENLIK